MRWKTKPRWIQDDERTIQVFLWIPMKVQNEWRWLEWATVRQKYKSGWPLPDILCGRWKNVEWMA